jgi:hypothetical protein
MPCATPMAPTVAADLKLVTLLYFWVNNVLQRVLNCTKLAKVYLRGLNLSRCTSSGSGKLKKQLPGCFTFIIFVAKSHPSEGRAAVCLQVF